MSRSLLRAALAVALTVPLLATVVAGAPSARAAVVDLCAPSTPVPAGMTRYTWVGTASVADWKDATNWALATSAGPVPPAQRRAPNYFGQPHDPASDDSTDGYLCIKPSAPTTITVDGDVSVFVVAFDIGANATIVGHETRFMAFGDPAQYSSYLRSGADMSVTAGYFGGPGLVQVESGATLDWRSSQQFSSSFETDLCDTHTPALAACATPRPAGRLLVQPGGTLAVRTLAAPGVSRGVNLNDRYRLEVAGTLRIVGDTYIAQSDGTSIEVAAGGALEFDGDGHVFQGFVANPPSLAPFVNRGTVRKTAGDGVSSITTAYDAQGAGSIDVVTGSVSVPQAAVTAGTVDGGHELATGECYAQAGGGIPAGGTNVALPDCLPSTSLKRLQVASVRVPEAADDVPVEIEQLGPVEADDPVEDVQAPLRVQMGDLPAGAVARMDLAFDRTIQQLPDKTEFEVFRREIGRDEYRKVPDCADDAGRSLPNGVTACIDRDPSAPRAVGRGAEALILRIKAEDLSGDWAVSRSGWSTTFLTRSGSTFQPDDPASSAPAVSVVNDVHPSCGPAADRAWTSYSAWRDVSQNDHSLGWQADGDNDLRGVGTTVGDLADLRAFDIGLRTSVGTLRGVVRIRRHVSATTYWEGFAPISPEDAPSAGIGSQPSWRILDGTTRELTWTKYVDGDEAGESVVGRTFRGLVRYDAPTRSAGAPADEVAFLFGCAGERFLIDDLRIQRRGDLPDDHYDFEAPQPTIEFASRTPGPRQSCFVSWGDHPNTGRTIPLHLSHAADLSVRWRKDPDDESGWAVVGGRTNAPAGDVDVPYTVKETGYIGVTSAGSPISRRSAVGGGRYFRVHALPEIDLTRLTRKVPFGKKVKISGYLRLGSDQGGDPYALGGRRMQLRVLRPGTGAAFPQAASITVTTAPSGYFSFSWTAPKTKGLYRFAAFFEGVGEGATERIAPAMSNRALKVRVFQPKTPAQKVQPTPVAVIPDYDDQPTYDDGDGNGFTRSRAGCVYQLTRPQ